MSFSAKASGSALDLLALHVLCFLAMGWAVVGSWGAVSRGFSPLALRGVLLGGTLYTAGLVPWACRGLEYHNAVWHLFVLAASCCPGAAALLQPRGCSPACALCSWLQPPSAQAAARGAHATPCIQAAT